LLAGGGGVSVTCKFPFSSVHVYTWPAIAPGLKMPTSSRQIAILNNFICFFLNTKYILNCSWCQIFESLKFVTDILNATLETGARHGKNDFRRLGYGGPCPPGGTHRYFFKLYALDTELNLDSGITKAQLVGAMQGHILAEARLMGRYKR
jgi:hypothetical protein